MRKLSFEIWFPIATLVFFVAFLICFRYWADTSVYTSQLCKHWNQTTAILDHKTPIGGCYWRVSDNKQVDEQWFTCENYNVGDVIPFDEADYTCD